MQENLASEYSLRLNSLFCKNAFPMRRNLFKRTFDIFFSSFVILSALTIGLPFFLLIILLIKTTSKGPIFHIQHRVTRGGRTYPHIKFRTMYQNAEEVLQELLKKNPILKEEWIKYCKLKNDPRITPIGKILRKSSLDEFPQFWNVFCGDLSVVGPRPMVCEDVLTYFGDRAPKILSVRPGITGLWQVSGRSNLSSDERVNLEEKYVDSQSMLFDMQLICKTIPVIFTFKGAY